jgi:hypothetical protein
MRLTGPHPAADHERQIRESHSLSAGLRLAQGLDTAISHMRVKLIAYARKQLGL